MLGEIASRATALIVGSQADYEIATIDGGSTIPITVVLSETWETAAGVDAICRALIDTRSPTSYAPPFEPCPDGSVP